MKRCDLRRTGSALAAAAILTGCTGSAITSPPMTPVPPKKITSLVGETLTSGAPTVQCHSHYTFSAEYVHIPFSARGSASGPFPGTFKASGSISLYAIIGPTSPTVVHLKERFTISSGNDQIGGSARTHQYSLLIPQCYPSGNHVVVPGSAYRVNGNKGPGATTLTVGKPIFKQTFH